MSSPAFAREEPEQIVMASPKYSPYVLNILL